MRDDPLDAPIPETLTDSSSSYHINALQQAEKQLKSAKKISCATAFKKATKEYEDNKNYHQQAIERTAKECFNLAAVLAKAAQYKAPTPDHENFRDFMIEQLTATIKHDGDPSYHVNALKELRVLSGKEWKQKEADTAKKDIEYHSKELKKSTSRNQERNQWLKDLRQSLQNL